ncbi:MAG: dockerin type I repeat-containing protein [Clostridia bacterium]|nr:dockerin type I repeat-containing protein [Clostridia bacterium]
MKKMKKLLSVLLAVVIALSCMSVMASAAKANYKTVADLDTAKAYSPYGQVTRLSTEERASIVLDFLDNVLPGLNINMGKLFDILGLSITIDLTSVDQLCYSFDTIKGVLNSDNFLTQILVGIVKGIVNLGVLEKVSFADWDTGMKRAEVNQLKIFEELFALLDANGSKGVITDVLSNGLDLGIIGGMIQGLDTSEINKIVTGLPAMIKGLVFPLIERWDDTLSLIKTYDGRITGNGNVENTVNERVKKLFSDNMSITTVKYDANGEMTSEHKGMPIYTTVPGAPSNDSPRCYYYQNGNTLKIYHIVDQAEADASVKANKTDSTVKVLTAYTYVEQEETYYLEQEVPGSETYVWKTFEVDEDGEFVLNEKGEKKVLSTLKWYNDDSKLLRGDFDGDDFDLATMSAGDLLYKFIPALFEDLAVVVVNGSLKKILAEFFGARFEYIGDIGSDEVNALPDSSNAMFTEEQGDYAFEWSDYLVVEDAENGDRHYWRYEDQIWVADLSRTNNYFNIIDWNYNIDGNFMEGLIPTSDDDASERLLLNLNDFLVKVAETVVLPSANTVDKSGALTGEDANRDWTRPAFTKGGNSNLVNNLKAAAQAVISLAPEHIFGSDYATNERCYYDLLVSEDNDTVLTGIAAMLVDIIMPSMTLPGKSDIIASGAKVGAILAAVVREFAAYLTPEYNYDALIYTDFGATDGVKNFVTGKDSGYWFDVILTMGINVGFEYIRAFADMGEDSAEWTSFVAYSGYKVNGGAYTEADLKLTSAVNYWEGMLDYVVDWALTTDKEWAWKMGKFVDYTGTVNLSAANDPWEKIDSILFGLIPFDEILTIEPKEGQTKFEHFLRDDLILGLVDLKWDHLINTVQFNGANKYFRTANVLDQLAKLIKSIVNNLLEKIGSYSATERYSFIPAAVTDFDSLANQSNIATLATDLVSHLLDAYNNGLLDVALPFLNMFLGWKTDAQQLADPAIALSFRDGKNFAYQWNPNTNKDTAVGEAMNATYIKITNNSAGMLETHRNSSVTDHAYDIEIKNVTSDATKNKLTFNYDETISPYEMVQIEVAGTYNGEEAVTVTIEYEYVGKDGQPIGGKQYTSVSFLISNQNPDTSVAGRKDGDDNNDKTGTDAFGRYQFTEDIYNTVVNYQPNIFYVAATSGNSAKSLGTIAAPDWDGNCEANRTYYYMDENAQQYFDFRAADADAGWAKQLDNDQNKSTRGYLYKAKSGVTADTEIPYGAYYMGRIAVAYGSHNIRYEITFVHYNDHDIGTIYEENKNNGYNAYQGVDAATYEAYRTAWNKIVYLATYPMMTEANGHASTDYVATIQPQIPDAITAFEAAKEAYETALAEADANASAGADADIPSQIVALQKEIDNDFDTKVVDGKEVNNKEINFQDYEYYEYFNYQDIKVAAENLYRTYLAPEVMDTYYIMGSGIREEELNYVIGYEANPVVKAAIEASRMENDKDAISASQAAHDEWEMPVTTKLVTEDFISRLAYYKQFLFNNRENALTEEADHMYFLEKEIAYIDAQGLDAADYEAVTWGRFADALEVARTVAAGEDEFSAYNSRIYDVKYNLMVAYKQLLAKDASLIEAGGTAELDANIVIANEIFASLAAGDGVWTLKEGVDADEAYAELLKTLGYNYQAVYTKHDAEVKSGEKEAGELKVNDDGTPMMFNLYADSALEYSENDRPNKAGNKAKVDAANAALVAAMANFEKAVTDVEFEGVDGGLVKDTTEEGADMSTGFVYGIEVGATDVDKYFTTNDTGSIEVVANATGKTNGTGATLVVKDKSDNVVGEYILVVFGDVDGDGALSGTDALYIKQYAGGNAGRISEEANLLAADADNDTSVSGTDALKIKQFAGGNASAVSQAR